MTGVCLQVFSRPPVAGEVKTRLIPALAAQGAAALHEYLAERVFAAVARTPAVVRELWIAGDSGHPWVAAACGRHGFSVRQQTGDDLGARMAHAATSAWARQLMPIIVGTDCWLLDAAYLTDAVAALGAGSDVVLGPVEDGGYVLIGLRQPALGLFADMTWSVPTVLADTLLRCAALRLRVRQLPTLWDVDRPEDVMRLRALGVRWDVPAA